VEGPVTVSEGEPLPVTVVRVFRVGIFFEACEVVYEGVYALEVGEPGVRGLLSPFPFRGGPKGLVGDGVGRFSSLEELGATATWMTCWSNLEQPTSTPTRYARTARHARRRRPCSIIPDARSRRRQGVNRGAVW